MLSLENLMEPHEIAERYPTLFTEKQLDWMLRKRHRTGMDRAVVKVGRKLFIDKAEFERWIEGHREVSAA